MISRKARAEAKAMQPSTALVEAMLVIISTICGMGHVNKAALHVRADLCPCVDQ